MATKSGRLELLLGAAIAVIRINLMDDRRMDPSGRQPVDMSLGQKVAGLRQP